VIPSRSTITSTVVKATIGLAIGCALADPLARWLHLDDPWLVRAGFVGLWAQMNYAQMTSLFRVEERPVGLRSRASRTC